MVREAESHADEDKKRREEVETRNQADQAVYQAEKLLQEAGDKLSDADRQPVRAAIDDLKQALERNDSEAVTRGMQALQQAQYKIADVLYRDQRTASAPGEAGGGPGAGGPAAGGPAQGEVIDAEVVDDDKR
jgi:molecular chaperone DnaK